jgi:hypothetical protein
MSVKKSDQRHGSGYAAAAGAGISEADCPCCRGGCSR